MLTPSMKERLTCILVIDDDEPTNFLNRIIIEESYCAEKIVTVQSAQDALEYINCARAKGIADSCPMPDLIFLDINMPCMDGWEFMDNYRLLYEDQKPPAILLILTTSFNPEDEVKAKSLDDIAGYINKPLTQGVMKEVLKEYFPTVCGL
jgi:CheY-like chemotaxis protein